MPANLRNARVGVENRAKVNAALLAAGLAGMNVHELAEATSLTEKSVVFYCRTSGIISQGLSSNHRVRWFHPEHAAGAEAYRVELENRVRPVSRCWGKQTADDAMDVVHKAGPAGITMQEVAAVLGLNPGTVNSALVACVQAGQIQRFAPYHESKRYYGLGVELPKHKGKSTKSRAKPKELHKKPGVKPGTIRKPKEPQQRPVLAHAYAMPRVSAFASAEAIMPKDVKITVCPAGKDHRFTADPEKVERFFSRPDYRPEFIGQGRWSAAVVESRA